MSTQAPRQLLRLATAGSVDDGKSTLIGRLLYDTDSLPTDHLEAVAGADGVPDLAALSDGLRAEREQGITIDVAYRFFSTDTRNYILADTPGHEHYTRNMFTGASTAHVAILLVDATAGVLRQTRRHARIAALLGVRHLVAAVNKIDLAGYDQNRYHEVESEIHRVTDRLVASDVQVIPIAAKHGDNVVHRSANTPWYSGPTLLEYLESIELVAPHPEYRQLRLPVQWASRPQPGERRRYTGRLSAGTVTAGDTVRVLPAGLTSTVTAVDTLDDDRAVAVAPLSVSLEFADNIDVGRGSVVISGAPDAPQPVLAREIDATVCWFGETPLRAGDRLSLKHTTSTVRATVQALHSRLDPETLDEHDRPTELALNDIGSITLRTSSILIADRYADNRDAGAFILIDEHSNDTVGAGTIVEAREIKPDRPDPPGHQMASVLARTHPPLGGDRAARRHHLVHRTARLRQVDRGRRPGTGAVESGRTAYLLDGDNVRHGLSDDLGFSPGDRAENIRRVGHLTRLFADAGVVAIASLVSPLESDRAIARELHAAAKLPFLEIYVSTPLAECQRRDPKGLYAKARAGELTGLTGVDAPYEPPTDPDLTLDTTGADIDDLVKQVLELLHTGEESASRP